jgi:hypothetical protein
MFRRKPTYKRELSKIGARVARIPVSDLPMWAEQSLSDTGRSFTSWLRRGDPVNLEEAILGAEALAEILRSVRDRT